MDSRHFINQYEQLKGKEGNTVKEKLGLEREWIELYKQMNFASKKTKNQSSKKKKKRKNDLKTFIHHSHNEARKLSQQIFKTLLPKPNESFDQLCNEYEHVYFKVGVQGLIELYTKRHKTEKEFNDLLKEQEQIEKMNAITRSNWKEKVEEVAWTKVQTLSEAFALEKECCFLFAWRKHDKKKHGKKADEKTHQAYNLLNSKMDQLANFILKELNYSSCIFSLIPTKRHREHFLLHGILSLFQLLEEEKELTPSFMEDLLTQIAFTHPLDEFPEARQMNRHFVLHIGPTNSGKTYRSIERLKEAKKGIYLAPRRLLALEIFDKLNYQGVPCNLRTGDSEAITPHANHCSAIIEMASFQETFDVAVVDEVQMIDDTKRGNAWFRAIFGLKAHEIHLCGAPHALEFLIRLIEECGDTYEVFHHERQTDLVVEEESFSFPHSVRKGDALIVFSKSKVLEVANELKQAGIKASIIYGKLPAETRKRQVELFARGENEVIVATDAIGIGLNLPIERVVLLETEKFDGSETRPLTTQEIKQICGRAGRKGLYEKGFVNAIKDKEHIKEQLHAIEPSITKSVISPTLDLTRLSIGTLRQRLQAWKESPLPVDYVEKADISDQLSLIKHIEHFEHELNSEQVFKSLYIAFDQREKHLLYQWIEYVRALKNDRTSVQKPNYQGSSIYNLEKYYHQLTLYYNFSRKFNMDYDYRWISSQKKSISDNINRQIRLSNRRYVS